MADNRKTCFVICPIGDSHADLGKPERIIWEDSVQVWEKVIEPACKELGITALRADRISKAGEIPEQVCRQVRDADVVVADLTGGNANVMYELGLRHTLLKPTIQIGERGRLPFDVAAIRTIMFLRSEGGLIEARNNLKEALTTAMAEGSDAVTATRVWNEATSGFLLEPHNAAVDTVDTSADEEAGYLEKLAEAEEAIQQLSSKVGSITEIIRRVGATTSESAEEVRRSNNVGGRTAARLAIAERTARKLDDIADNLEPAINDYEVLVARAVPGMEYLLSRLEEGLEDEERPTEFIHTMLLYGDALETSQRSIEQFVGTLQKSGDATRSLRRTTSRLAASVRRMADGHEIQLGWVERLRRLPADA